MTAQERGFTLIELVITMVLSVIVVSFMAQFISGPVQGYADQSRRAELVDLADTALRRLTRDVRGALPNSLRVRDNGTTVALELLAADDGARYRDVPPPAADDDLLDFTVADDAFNVVSGFLNIAKPFSSTSHYLSIYNAGVPDADAYELSNVITPPGTSIDISAAASPGEDRVEL
ncbi:MAG: type II secretion system protein, partial [Woeseiaceae bacterium]|nr:type II secretion system protein [Woeseiaceae bacterium]